MEATELLHAVAEELDVKTVCAWCGKVMKEGPEGRVSHGICKECFEKHFPDAE